MLQELDVLAGDVTVNIPSAEGTQGGEGKGEGEGEGEGDEGKSKSSAASAVEEDAPPPALPRFVRQFSLDECGSSFRDPFDLPALPALSKHISIEERREARDQNASRVRRKLVGLEERWKETLLLWQSSFSSAEEETGDKDMEEQEEKEQGGGAAIGQSMRCPDNVDPTVWRRVRRLRKLLRQIDKLEALGEEMVRGREAEPHSWCVCLCVVCKLVYLGSV